MRQSILFALAIILMTACENQVVPPDSKFIPVTVVNQFCGTTVFKIQDEAYYSFGETADDQDNVFYGILECHDYRQELPMNTVLFAELNPTDFTNGCAICLAVYGYPGRKTYNVRIHQLTTETGQ